MVAASFHGVGEKELPCSRARHMLALHLLSSPHQFTDLNGPNTERLETKETLSQRQARWSEKLSASTSSGNGKLKQQSGPRLTRPRFQIGNRGAQRNQHCVC
jgi:hypothetical protein